MKYTYSWTVLGDDDPKKTGKPDSTLLNRHEGYEVLPFINRFSDKHSLKNKEAGLKIEKMIRENLPGEVRGHKKRAFRILCHAKKSLQR
ncbi:hypothetical protein VSX61_06650, partial [Brenneria populi subsp. brevivirga]|uniref:hypothetical protein n=1 Tax=Brenneria populi TaxID=1505588 RepID=UPI002E18B1D0|nr:hypothetical protein [Brenneria populi subsp. brevivirga]